MMTATMYKLLVSDFANPYALASTGLASGEAFTYVLLVEALGYFQKIPPRPLESYYLNLDHDVSPVLLCCIGYYLNLAVEGFAHSSLTVKSPDFTLAYTLAASSRVLFDLFITFGMTITLYRSRSGVEQTDHVITLMILFIVNTNLLTTLLSISELVTVRSPISLDARRANVDTMQFFALPTAAIYGGLGFLTPKCRSRNSLVDNA
ncbi:hypothetical protein EYR38_002317 [Pleurotus pulmonarius]|nr:hypothetical protein EYR38_002317 [Pleurotus pulmonarius]